MKKLLLYATCGMAGVLLLAPVSVTGASELVWIPINPSFGGSPYNASWLMASAQAQNRHVAEPEGYTRPDPIDDFEYSLNRALLSRLSRKILDEAFGEESLLPEGETEAQYTVGDYTIDITTDGQINVQITDTLTGDITIVQVPYY